MVEYNPVELILSKRNGKDLSANELSYLVSGYLNGQIPEYQMSVFLMCCYFQGLSGTEIAALTDIYIRSGKQLTFPEGLLVADKHSTGGVGDKISLMLAPIAASLGLYVPMISGRGLGHTGGTLDKLEAIAGFRTAYAMDEFYALVMKHGMALVGQSDELVPADKRIYALRDVTATVESPGLITASIMSKKIAEGARHLVIDLKVGSGAFMPNLRRAKELAEHLIATGNSFSQKVSVVFSNMNSPLGNAVGNALETIEAIEYLKGNYLPDTYELTTTLTAQMLLSSGLASGFADAKAMIDNAVGSGKALAKLQEVIEAQGGNPKVIDDYSLFDTAPVVKPILAPQSGWVHSINSRAIGYALVQIKAGRMKVSDSINYAAGALLTAKIGDQLCAGDRIGEVHAQTAAEAELAARQIKAAYTIGEFPVETEPLILDIAKP